MKYKTFETERLFLRPTDHNDGPMVYKLLNSPKWLKFIGDRNVSSVEEAEEYIAKKMTPQLERLGFANYTVIRKEDGEKMGSCGLYDREGIDGLDIGFSFLPEFFRMGYAYESSLRIIKAAKEDFGITKISAITIKTNIASQKLLEKLGLVFIKYMRIPNDTEELMYYEMELK